MFASVMGTARKRKTVGWCSVANANNGRTPEKKIYSSFLQSFRMCLCRTAGNHNKINRVRCRYFSCKHFPHAAISGVWWRRQRRRMGSCSTIWFWCECALAFFLLIRNGRRVASRLCHIISRSRCIFILCLVLLLRIQLDSNVYRHKLLLLLLLSYIWMQ